MILNKKENTIVLKELESNIIDQAIVLLKPGVKIKQKEFNFKNLKLNKIGESQDAIILEAQNTINNYISEIQKKYKRKEIRNLKQKYIASKIINFVLLICIAIIIEKFI